jgi:hypothetical protein
VARETVSSISPSTLCQTASSTKIALTHIIHLTTSTPYGCLCHHVHSIPQAVVFPQLQEIELSKQQQFTKQGRSFPQKIITPVVCVEKQRLCVGKTTTLNKKLVYLSKRNSTQHSVCVHKVINVRNEQN